VLLETLEQLVALVTQGEPDLPEIKEIVEQLEHKVTQEQLD
jgi:hypothetical protein